MTSSVESRLYGPPGTGKTTTLSAMIVDAAREYGSDKVLVTSFTKAAAVELVGRNLPVDASQVGTLHAICYRALGNPTIAETRMSEWNDAYPSLRMTASASGNDDPSWDMSMRSEADKMMASYQTQRSRLIPRDKQQYDGVFDHADFGDFVQKWEGFKRENDYLDFTDMIESGLREFDTAPGDPDIMFLDEAQDMAPLELSLARRWGSHMQRLVLAADDDQAIYAFKGSDPQAIFDTPYRDATVLEQSYRVPRAVHEAATKLIKTLSWRIEKEYRPRREVVGTDDRGKPVYGPDYVEGFVKNLWSADYGNPGPAVKVAKQLVAEGKSVMFLASCSYMLRETCEALKEAGVPYHNPYKPRRADWNPLAFGTAARRTAMDRVHAYLAVREDARGADAHVWNTDEFKLWAQCVDVAKFFRRGTATRLKDKQWALPEGGPGARLSAIAEMLRDDADALPDDQHFGNAIEGNLDWLAAHLKGDQGNRMRYPVKVAQEMGPKALIARPLVTVGTVHCSPADEPILTTVGWVPIGSLDPLVHRLAGYDRKSNSLSWGRRGGFASTKSEPGYPFSISKRHYDGDIIEIASAESRTRVTPNHRVLMRFNEKFMEKWVVYLMRRGDWWRIGVCTSAHRPYRSGGVGGRLATEQADYGWILSVHETRASAIIAEARAQCEFGIPGLTFEASAQRSLSSADLHRIHTDAAPYVSRRVDALLESFGMSRDWPLYSRAPLRGEVIKRNMREAFITEAANMKPLSGYVDVSVPSSRFLDHGIGRQAPSPLPATATSYPFSGDVYGLDIPPYHHYVSGGAVVHNSVKGGESDVVFLYPDVSYAGHGEWKAVGPRRDSVARLFYVALTRAREGVYLCGNATQQYVKLWGD